MKKTLMFTAAVLLLSAVSASAGPTYTIRLDGTADTFEVTKVGQLYAQVHYFADQVESRGVGMAATTGFADKGFMLTDVQQNGTEFVCYDFSYPLPNTSLAHVPKHGEWYAYSTFDGKHVRHLGWGTYTVVGVTGK